MSEDQETAIRRALDAVDRGRRWAMISVSALFVITVIALGALLGAAARPDAPPTVTLKTLYAASIVQMLFIACCTAMVMFQVTRMANAVLRQIESTKR